VLQALVLGNGESRKSLDIENLSNHFTTIGCNAIVRDHPMDYVVCCDVRMAQEASRINQHRVGIFVRPQNMVALNRVEIFKPLPNIPYVGTQKQDRAEHWGSGPYAVLLATELGFPKIVLAGFDLYPSNGKINNIYKGTQHYLPETADAVDPAYWIYQIGMIFKINPFVEFTVLNNEGWKIPEEWRHDHVHFQNINDFVVDKGN